MRAYVKEIPGRIHEKIEDTTYESVFLNSSGEETGLFIIADGMSGFAGTTASHSIACYLRENVEMVLRKESISSYENLLKDAITNGSNFLEQNDKGRSTLDVVLVSPRNIYYAHLGDSCIYSLSSKGVEVCTPLEKDKWGVPVNFVGKTTVEGDTRSVRERIYFKSEERNFPTAPDYILLATDGLLSRLTTEEITQTFSMVSKDHNPKEVLDLLCELVYNPQEKIRDSCTPREFATLLSLCGKEDTNVDEGSLLKEIRICYARQKNEELVTIIDGKLRWDDTSLVLIDLKNAVEKKISNANNLRTIRIPALEKEKEAYEKKLEDKDTEFSLLQDKQKEIAEKLSVFVEEKKQFDDKMALRDEIILQKEKQIEILEEEKKKRDEEIKASESRSFLDRLFNNKPRGIL